MQGSVLLWEVLNMGGNDRQGEIAKPMAQAQEESAEEALFNDAVKELSRSIEIKNVAGGLQAFDDRIYKMDLGPVAADKVINDVFAELKKTGKLPDLISGFYAETKGRLFLDGKSYLDLETLDRRLPGGGVYDLNRVERHAVAFLADNIEAISQAKWNPTYSSGQTSDADFVEYAKQQREQLDKYLMAQKVQKHFGRQESFDALDRAWSGRGDGKVHLDDLKSAAKMNSWMAEFTADAKTKELAQERQQTIVYLIKNFQRINGSSYGLSKDELNLFVAGEADPRRKQVLNTDSRLFVGNPGPEAYQQAVSEGYQGSLNSFTTEFVAQKMKDGMSRSEALRELNRGTELHGFRADVIKQYLSANKEGLGASRTDEITKEGLERLKEMKAGEGKLREVEILEAAINRFESIANADKESSWFDDSSIKPKDLDAYAASQKSLREKANLSVKMHNLAHANIHELSGESTSKDKFSIQVPWSKIDSMQKFYSGVGQDSVKFTDEQRRHHKEMAEVCDYLKNNFRQSVGRGGVSPFNLHRSYQQTKSLGVHNKDKFDAPVKPEAPKQAELHKQPELHESTPKVEPVSLAELAKTQIIFTTPVEGGRSEDGWTRAGIDVPDVFKQHSMTPELPQANEPNLYDFTGDAGNRIIGSQVGKDLPQMSPSEPVEKLNLQSEEVVRTNVVEDVEPLEEAEQSVLKETSAADEFAKVKEAFQYDEKSYYNALRQAARLNLPLVLVAGTRRSSDEFLKSAAAQAQNGDGKAIHVFVDLDEAGQDLPITKYLELSISQRNFQLKRHDDSWTSVFQVRNGADGAIVNERPIYWGTGDEASEERSVQKAIEEFRLKAVARNIVARNVIERNVIERNVIERSSSHEVQANLASRVTYSYEPRSCQPMPNYYNSNHRFRGRVFGFRR